MYIAEGDRMLKLSQEKQIEFISEVQNFARKWFIPCGVEIAEQAIRIILGYAKSHSMLIPDNSFARNEGEDIRH